MTASAEATGLETSHIDVISVNDRHGQPRDLFPVWFSSNLSIGNAVFGALAIAVGNSFWWAVIAVLVGNVVGGVFMSLHSVQGARLGVPQLIQSRGQFGFYGALLPVFLAAFLYGGFFVVTAILSGQALAAAAPDTFSTNPSLLVLSLVSLGIALAGYRFIHVVARWALWPLAGVVVIVTIAALAHGDVSMTLGTFHTGPFFTAVGFMATFLLTYAPYVSDYSRYLPVDSSASACFGWTFAGVFVSATWANLLGVVLAAQTGGTDIFGPTKDLISFEPLAVVVLVLTAFAIAGNSALNLYGGMLNLITGLSSFTTIKPSFVVRLLFLLPTFAIGLWLSVQASADFYTQLSNFLSFLMLGFVPWGAINLLDFYLVRHGHYDIDGFFNDRGSYFRDPAAWTFGGFNLKSYASYAIGVLAAIPFVGNGWYVGAASKHFGGADISWIPGLIVTGVVYLGLSRMMRSSATAPTRVSHGVVGG
jgi:purine-cytosine permease-like protein